MINQIIFFFEKRQKQLIIIILLIIASRVALHFSMENFYTKNDKLHTQVNYFQEKFDSVTSIISILEIQKNNSTSNIDSIKTIQEKYYDNLQYYLKQEEEHLKSGLTFLKVLEFIPFIFLLLLIPIKKSTAPNNG